MKAHQLWAGLRPLTPKKDLTGNIQMPSVFRSLNYIALIICLFYPLLILLLGDTPVNLLGIVTSFLPALLCAIAILLLRYKKLDTAMFVSFILVPISITIKATYEPIGGIMLYPLSQSIICFFVLRKRSQIISVFITSMLSFSVITIYYEYLVVKSFTRDFILLIFGLMIFITMLYFIFSFIRNTIEEYHTIATLNERELLGKNNILKIQNTLIRDQSTQLEKKQQLLLSANELQQRINSLLSHDIRTSVMALKNIFTAYRKGNISKDEIIECLPMLEKETVNMNTLFDDILSLANEDNVAAERFKEKVDPKELIKEICLTYSAIANNKNIDLQYSISSSALVHVNPKFVKIILRNLISNAIKFTGPGGNIKISNFVTDNGPYKILVQDNGEGMSPDKLEKIRKGVGLTTKGTSNESGTGLGLSFCREFVSKCGGKLEVNSSLGKGTTFSFTLPIAQ